jgi:hypothetical protein
MSAMIRLVFQWKIIFHFFFYCPPPPQKKCMEDIYFYLMTTIFILCIVELDEKLHILFVGAETRVRMGRIKLALFESLIAWD